MPKITIPSGNRTLAIRNMSSSSYHYTTASALSDHLAKRYLFHALINQNSLYAPNVAEWRTERERMMSKINECLFNFVYLYLDFGQAGSLSLQLYWTYHRLLHMREAVNNHALPIYKKNRIASLLCIFESTIYETIYWTLKYLPVRTLCMPVDNFVVCQ